MFMVQKHNFHMKLDPENFRTDFVWSKKSNPVLNLLQYIYYKQSWSNQNDLSWKLIVN